VQKCSFGVVSLVLNTWQGNVRKKIVGNAIKHKANNSLSDTKRINDRRVILDDQLWESLDNDLWQTCLLNVSSA